MSPSTKGAEPAPIDPRHQSGQHAEQRARQLMEEAGLVHLASNVRYRLGELDLVMRDAECIVFVEVRLRRTASHGGAIGSVDARKQLRIRRAAQLWLQQNTRAGREPACRFDLVTLDGAALARHARIEWIRDAF